MKRILHLCLVLALSVAMLASCTQAPAESETPASESQETSEATTETEETDAAPEAVELRFSWWGSEDRHEATLAAIDKYVADNAHVTIVPEYSGYSGYQDKLVAQIAAGNAPDVFSSVSEWIPQQMASDALLDLTGLVDVSDHNEMVVESCSFDGMLVSVPLGLNAPTFVYNTRIIEELGIELPTGAYTWDDFADICLEIYEKSNGEYYGVTDLSTAYEQLLVYGYTALAHPAPYPYDNTTMTVTEEDMVSYYSYWKEMRESGAAAPADISSTSFDQNLVGRGIVAFAPVWSSTFGQFQNETEDELDMITVPTGENGESGATSRASITLSVFNNSPAPEEAAAFVDWFIGSEDAALILTTTRGVFSGATQRDALVATDTLNEIDTKIFAATDYYASNEMKMFYPGPDRISEIFGGNGDLVERIGQEIAFGDLSVEEGAAKFMEEANKILGS